LEYEGIYKLREPQGIAANKCIRCGNK